MNSSCEKCITDWQSRMISILVRGCWQIMAGAWGHKEGQEERRWQVVTWSPPGFLPVSAATTLKHLPELKGLQCLHDVKKQTPSHLYCHMFASQECHSAIVPTPSLNLCCEWHCDGMWYHSSVLTWFDMSVLFRALPFSIMWLHKPCMAWPQL